MNAKRFSSIVGTPAEHSGIFGAAESRAAEILGADRAFFCVHGSTGANWVVLRMIALLRPDAHVLIARNVHHSVINALKAYGVSFSFITTVYDQLFEAFGPPHPDDIAAALACHPNADAVLLTSPTYEGLGADTAGIADVVHRHSPDTLVIVDEAWGAHLAFHEDLPLPAMHSGADVCVQSTHKLGGSLQQTGLILWREERAESDLLERAFAEYATTSPSFHLLASVEAAQERLLEVGEQGLTEILCQTADLRQGLLDDLPELDVLDESSWIYGRSGATGLDRTKTTVALSRFAMSGYELAEALLQREGGGIVAEKAGINSLTLLATFQLPATAYGDARAALGALLSQHLLPSGAKKPSLENPFDALADEAIADPSVVARRARLGSRIVALDDAVGSVAAEQVEVYPPGIPVILEGFPVSARAVEYLRATAALGGSIVARDGSLETLRVLPNAAG